MNANRKHKKVEPERIMQYLTGLIIINLIWPLDFKIKNKSEQANNNTYRALTIWITLVLYVLSLGIAVAGYFKNSLDANLVGLALMYVIFVVVTEIVSNVIDKNSNKRTAQYSIFSIVGIIFLGIVLMTYLL